MLAPSALNTTKKLLIFVQLIYLPFLSNSQKLYFLQGEHHVQKTCDHIYYCLDFLYAFVFHVVLKIKTTQAGT